MKPAIVVVAFNRQKSLKTLLDSLDKAHYSNDDITLVISIDGAKNEENKKVIDEAINFKWRHGIKDIIEHTENLGLRKHILNCGELTNKYGSIIMLEDDLLVSKHFYNYSLEALSFYDNDKNIAGISLYSQKYNETAGKSFQPLLNGTDGYFMQLASSWGQAWTKTQWNNFIHWYNAQKDVTFFNDKLPYNIRQWSQQSWKKYFIKYLIEQNKYFIYPYESLTTNMREKGVHAIKQDNLLQVPLLSGPTKKFIFPEFNNSIVNYDAFHENINLKKELSEKYKRVVEIDIYGVKKIIGNELILTTQYLNFEIIKSYALKMVPHEENVIQELKGEGIYLYNLKVPQNNSKDMKNINTVNNLDYYFNKYPMGKKRNLIYIVSRLLSKLSKKK